MPKTKTTIQFIRNLNPFWIWRNMVPTLLNLNWLRKLQDFGKMKKKELKSLMAEKDYMYSISPLY